MVDLNYEAWLSAMCVMVVYRCLNSAYGRHSVPLDQSECTHSMMIYDPIPTIPVAVFPQPSLCAILCSLAIMDSLWLSIPEMPIII